MLIHLKSFGKHGLYTLGWYFIFTAFYKLVDKVMESKFKEEWPRFRKQRKEEREQQSTRKQGFTPIFRKMKLENCSECDHLMIPLPDKVEDLDNPNAYRQRCISEDCQTGRFNRAFLIKSGIQLHKEDLSEEL